jgi:hypothetical protein
VCHSQLIQEARSFGVLRISNGSGLARSEALKTVAGPLENVSCPATIILPDDDNHYSRFAWATGVALKQASFTIFSFSETEASSAGEQLAKG